MMRESLSGVAVWRAVALVAFACLASAGVVRAQSQAEMNAEACGAFREADEELKRVYARVLSEYASDAKFVRKLRAAQRAWLTFRDAHLEARFPAEDKRGAYGSVFPMCFCGVQEELTRARTAQLTKWVEGLTEGDVCAGSVRIREEGSAGRRTRRRAAQARPTRVGGRRHASDR